MFVALNGEHYDSLAQARQAGAPTVNFGVFINNVISFMIVAFVLFMAIKGMNQLRPSRKRSRPPSRRRPRRCNCSSRSAMSWWRAVRAGSWRRISLSRSKAKQGFCAGRPGCGGVIARLGHYAKYFYLPGYAETILRLFAV